MSFECKATQIIQLENTQGGKVNTWVVFGEVVGVHINQSLLVNGVYDTANAHHILRGGGPADYFDVTPNNLFKMARPQV